MKYTEKLAWDELITSSQKGKKYPKARLKKRFSPGKALLSITKALYNGCKLDTSREY